jgi:hypothetical protein
MRGYWGFYTRSCQHFVTLARPPLRTLQVTPIGYPRVLRMRIQGRISRLRRESTCLFYYLNFFFFFTFLFPEWTPVSGDMMDVLIQLLLL